MIFDDKRELIVTSKGGSTEYIIEIQGTAKEGDEAQGHESIRQKDGKTIIEGVVAEPYQDRYVVEGEILSVSQGVETKASVLEYNPWNLGVYGVALAFILSLFYKVAQG